jgi:hypothetical protein
MAETTADVRRDIELTRERMSSTLDQLERKLNVVHIVRDNPWPALALAFGAGVALAGSKSDVKAATATVAATKGASSRVGTLLDDVAARVIGGATAAFNERIDQWVDDLKVAIGAPSARATPPRPAIERQVPRTVNREPASTEAMRTSASEQVDGVV